MLIGLLAGAVAPAFSAPAPVTCTRPPALAARLQSHPSVEAWADLGNWFGDHRQFACAQDAFRTGLRLSPASPQLNYLLGLSLYESENFDQAVAPLERCIKADATVLKPHLLLASVYARLGQPANAEQEWRASLRIDPSSTMAQHGLSQALLARGDLPGEVAFLHTIPPDDDLTIDLAIALARDGQLEQAVETVEDALKTRPDSVKLVNALVTLYIKVSRTFDAQSIAEKSYRLHPDDFSAQISYLRTLVVNGDWAPAFPLGKKVVSEQPHSFDALYLEGVLERQSGDYQAAREHLTAAEKLNPSLANLRANLGITLSRLHETAAAKTELEQAIALGDKDPETHFELANVLRALGDTAGARQEMVSYQEAVKEKDAGSLAVSKAAEAAQALDRGDTQRAVQLYRDAFAATPKNALLGYKLSVALDKAGDTDGERSILEQVVALDPSFALAQNQLGYLESRRGDYSAAESHFRQAVAAAPAFTEAWISLAATLGMESKFPEAQQAVASALRLDPRNSEAQQLSHDLSAAQTQPH
ncbi:MAG TPA: tetratricopeptide repeat protein [Acidobacteriaceae bacterium]|nr:tetratricopeptide repeat protein [Acidobacteriaceae bacterium]